MNNNLPVLPTLLEALSLPYKHWRILTKIGSPLLVVVFLYIVSAEYLSTNREQLSYAFWGSFLGETGGLRFTNNGIFIVVTCVLFAIAFILSLIAAVVGCHRVFILGEIEVEKSGLLRWSGNEIRFLGWCILIWILAWIVSLLFMTLVGVPLILPLVEATPSAFVINLDVFIVVYFVVFLLLSYIFSRWMLALPSSAVGERSTGPFWSWNLSTGNGWRLTCVVAFLPIASNYLFNQLPIHDSIVYRCINSAVWIVVGVVEIGLLSLSYKFLIDKQISETSRS